MTVFGDPLWAESMSLGNVLFYGFLAWYSFRRFSRMRDRYWMRALVFLFGMIGLYWAGLYVYVLVISVTNAPYDSVWFGRVFVRPAFLFTGALMASMAAYRWRIGD